MASLQTCKWDAGDGWKGVFRGKLVAGKPEGEGELLVTDEQDGDRYEGQFRAGKFHGQGKASYGFLDHYHGGWKDGKHHGYGWRSYDFGSSAYDGHWRDGEMHGCGIFTCTDGDAKCGQWENNELEVALPRREVEAMLKKARAGAAEVKATRMIESDAGLFDILKSPKYTKPMLGTLSGASRVVGSASASNSTRSPSSSSPSTSTMATPRKMGH